MCILFLAIHIFFLLCNNKDKISRRSISIPFRSHLSTQKRMSLTYVLVSGQLNAETKLDKLTSCCCSDYVYLSDTEEQRQCLLQSGRYMRQPPS